MLPAAPVTRTRRRFRSESRTSDSCGVNDCEIPANVPSAGRIEQRAKLFPRRGAGAVIEEDLPLQALEGNRKSVPRVLRLVVDLLDQIDEGVGIPTGHDQAQQRFVGG